MWIVDFVCSVSFFILSNNTPHWWPLDIDFSHNNINTGAQLQFQLAIDQWPSLVSFKINNNNLNGIFQIFGYDNPFLNTLDVSNNQFTGVLPTELNLFVALTYRAFLFAPFHFDVRRNLNLLGNSFSNLGGEAVLPPGMFAQTSELIKNTTATGQNGNFSCPNIYLNLVGHDPVRVQIDPYYHGYSLCLCDRNFRRVPITTSANNLTYPQFSVCRLVRFVKR